MTPDGFPEFVHVLIYRMAPDTAEIRWAVKPNEWPEDDLNFGIFRSNSPAGPWDPIATVSGGRFVFYDNEVISAGTSRTYYYVVRITSASGQGYRDSRPTRIEHDPDHIAIELVRKKQVFLRVKGGVEMVVYLRKRWGPKCSRCYSKERMESQDENCPDCYGTGYSGGYLNPVTLVGLFNPPEKVIVDAGIKIESGSTFFELGNWPTLDRNDLIIDRRMNIRYIIDSAKHTTHRGYPISQVARVVQTDETDIVYNLPLPENPWSAARNGRSYDFINRVSPNPMEAFQHDVPPRPY